MSYQSLSEIVCRPKRGVAAKIHGLARRERQAISDPHRGMNGAEHLFSLYEAGAPFVWNSYATAFIFDVETGSRHAGGRENLLILVRSWTMILRAAVRVPIPHYYASCCFW
jgi:hypothetical protein